MQSWIRMPRADVAFLAFLLLVSAIALSPLADTGSYLDVGARAWWMAGLMVVCPLAGLLRPKPRLEGPEDQA